MQFTSSSGTQRPNPDSMAPARPNRAVPTTVMSPYSGNFMPMPVSAPGALSFTPTFYRSQANEDSASYHYSRQDGHLTDSTNSVFQPSSDSFLSGPAASRKYFYPSTSYASSFQPSNVLSSQKAPSLQAQASVPNFAAFSQGQNPAGRPMERPIPEQSEAMRAGEQRIKLITQGQQQNTSSGTGGFEARQSSVDLAPLQKSSPTKPAIAQASKAD